MRAKYSIQDSDLYNFDETGFAMGMIGSSMVVTRSDRIGKPMAFQPGNREWVTAICCISADGHVVPTFICVKGHVQLSSWYWEKHIPEPWLIQPTEKGWTNNATGLEWLQHFDRHTRTRQQGQWRMLVLDRHDSHVNTQFNKYCKEHSIVPICLPPHSSHLTQPLDVGLFSPLKKAYARHINRFIFGGITHISKEDFFPAFARSFKRVFTMQNIKSGF
ncbi:CENP-B protein [Calocera cornea HHB12733]|uniref:CENP-B protein n=1 Tax=Calocera cornea HHB12733 TaxID=1353952 RepID=A0A165JZ85_9BASI|nr:CENP-B protein [Calocera cornea HHB12733]